MFEQQKAIQLHSGIAGLFFKKAQQELSFIFFTSIHKTIWRVSLLDPTHHQTIWLRKDFEGRIPLPPS